MTIKKKETNDNTKVGLVSRIVDKYGPMTVSVATLVIAIIFCLWFTTRQMNWMQKQFEAAQQQNYIEMVDLIQTTVNESVQTALDERDNEHNQRAQLRLELSPRVNADLKKALVEVDCDDIVVCEYHNGYTNIATNLPFCRYSVTYEVTRTGITQISQEFQSVPMSPFLTMTEPGKVSYFTKEDIKDIDNYVYYYMNREHARDIYLCPIMYEGLQCGTIACINVREHNTNQDKILQLSKDIAVYLHSNHGNE